MIGTTEAKIYINNVKIDYMPNSFKNTAGRGEKEVRTQNGGAGEISLVHTEKVDTKKGKVAFDLATTLENVDIVGQWQNLIGGITVKVEYLNGKVGLFAQGSVVNDPEEDNGSDGVMSIEIESLPRVLA